MATKQYTRRLYTNHCPQCGTDFHPYRRKTVYCTKRCKEAAKRGSLTEHFWRNVTAGAAGDCWEWSGTTVPDGYGSFNHERRFYLAHRVSYIIHHGDPTGLSVLHKCDNRPCVNPGHLFLGTQTDNMHDCAVKGRNHTKLTASDIPVIRADGRTYANIAADYGVTLSNIMAVKKRKTWRHVA